MRRRKEGRRGVGGKRGGGEVRRRKEGGKRGGGEVRRRKEGGGGGGKEGRRGTNLGVFIKHTS